MTPRRLAALVALVGSGLVVAGVAMVYVPAALIVAGVLLLSLLWIDIGGDREAR